MKKLLALAGAAAAVLAAVRGWRARKADADLWQEATAPRDAA